MATVLGGRWLCKPISSAPACGVGIDSREDLTGRAFFAIKGRQHDGHAFLHDAVRRGATLLVVHEDLTAAKLPEGAGVLRIDDTRRGLMRLASAYRDELRTTRVIAVTGSAGKTTTRRLIHQVLATKLRGSEAPRSFNNDIGVPLTLLAVQPADEYVVLEIGTNAPGEIAALAAVARPDIAVIVSIGRAHLERLRSIEGVAREKAAILDELSDDGIAIVTADAPSLRPHLSKVRQRVVFGLAMDADPRLTDRGRDDRGWWIEVNGKDRFHLGLAGEHNAINALAAIAVARRMGISDDAIDQALARAQPPSMRMTRQTIGPIEIHNDAYNANPDSMRASLAAFAESIAGAARRVVILGDMLELGANAPALHRELGDYLAEIDRRAHIALAILIGPMMAHVGDTLGKHWPVDRIMTVPDLSDAATARIMAALRPGDSVLLKGSRGIALERLIDPIRQRFGPIDSHTASQHRPHPSDHRAGCTIS